MKTPDELVIFLGVVGCLALMLALGLWWRRQDNSPPQPVWEGSPIDVTPIAKRLERLRANYVSAFPGFHSSATLHNQLLRAARDHVSQLSFFRRKRDPEDNFPSIV